MASIIIERAPLKQTYIHTHTDTKDERDKV